MYHSIHKTPLYTFFCISMLISSCDCLQNVTATVLDKETKQPLDSVYAHNGNDDHSYTDEKGNFKLEAISGGLCGCPPMTVILSKDNYETITTQIKNAGHETIYMKKIK